MSLDKPYNPNMHPLAPKLSADPANTMAINLNMQGNYIRSVKAIKHDACKAPISMIPRSALEAEAQVMHFGAEKYGRDNWRKGMEWTRLIDAALRHITAFNEGEANDRESNLDHLAHARCCLAFLIEYAAKDLGSDDRACQLADNAVTRS